MRQRKCAIAHRQIQSRNRPTWKNTKFSKQNHQNCKIYILSYIHMIVLKLFYLLLFSLQIKFVPNEDIYPINYSFVGSLKLTNRNILNIMKLQELKKKIFFKTTSNYSDISLNIVGEYNLIKKNRTIFFSHLLP